VEQLRSTLEIGLCFQVIDVLSSMISTFLSATGCPERGAGQYVLIYEVRYDLV